MQDDFVSLFAFNRWANHKMLASCQILTPEQYGAEPVPGWTSIRSTVHHICLVTESWLRSLLGDPNIQFPRDFPSETDLATVKNAADMLNQSYGKSDKLLATLTPNWLATPLKLQRRVGIVTLPPWAVFRHMVNHTTYHRGQVASKLKRLGVQQPETDLVYWVYEQIPQG